MSAFEFFMIFYGLLLGLAVAELLSGFANLLRSRSRPDFGLLTPAVGVLLFIQIMASFIDAFEKLQGLVIDVAGLALPTFIGIAYFTAAAIVVPRDAEEWSSLDEYFIRKRWWTVGAILAVHTATILIEIPIVIDAAAGERIGVTLYYVAANFILVAALVTALLARLRRTVFSALVVEAVLMLFFYSPLSVNVFSAPSA